MPKKGGHVIYPLFYILPLPSVVSLVEVHEVHTSAPVREVQRHARLTAPPFPPRRRRAMACQHSTAACQAQASLPLFSQADFSVGSCRRRTAAASRHPSRAGGRRRRM